jgi:hypothetical protein
MAGKYCCLRIHVGDNLELMRLGKTYATAPGGTPHDTGQTMEFFNMQKGDAPLFKSLADN